MLDFILYGLFLLAIVLATLAQIRVTTTYRKYDAIPCGAGLSAAEVARRMLDDAGLSDIGIERVGGELTDHYDPRARVLRLSDSVYDSRSAAAVGVAAHEVGHAIQHSVGYVPIRVRQAMVPLTGFASHASWIFIVIGCILMAISSTGGGLGYIVTLIGVGLFALTTLFQFVTLPCEFDASSRALANMRGSGLYTSEDLDASRRVLRAAALTYVGALAVSLLQLLRLIVSLFGNRNRR